MLDILIFIFPTVLLVVAFIIVIFSDSSLLSQSERELVTKLNKLYKSVQEPVTKWEEKAVPICEMWVYPVRGIRADAQVE